MPRGIRSVLFQHMLTLGIREEVAELLFPMKGVKSTCVQDGVDRLLRLVAGKAFTLLQESVGQRPDSDILARAIDKVIDGRELPIAGDRDIGLAEGVLRALPMGDRGQTKAEEALVKRQETRKRRSEKLEAAILKKARKTPAATATLSTTSEDEAEDQPATVQASVPDFAQAGPSHLDAPEEGESHQEARTDEDLPEESLREEADEADEAGEAEEA